MTKKEITSLFESFNQMTVLVVGDVMIDAYYSGNANRISPEAPVPVVHVTNSEKRLGGAANVAQNLKALGATPILCSVIGNDFSGSDFLNILKEENLPIEGILKSSERITTVKTRIISGSQQMLRVDEEEVKSFKPLQTRVVEDDIHIPHVEIPYKANSFGMFLNVAHSVHSVTPRIDPIERRRSVNIIGEFMKHGRMWEVEH